MNPAILIIDMQSRYLRDIRLKETEILIASQIEVLSQCSSSNIPAILIEFEGASETIREIINAWEKVNRKNLIMKSSLNAFDKTRLDRILKDWNIDQVILGGVEASACVYSTAVGALTHKYSIGTSKDLIADPYQATSAYENTVDFFKVKGDLFNDHKELLEYLNKAVLI
ncbi:cysteine hydrolase [archaeon]|nr:cysteine hydrolase [archaeon]